jgi:putative transposase
MSYVKIWVHVVWGTKNREPILQKGKRQQLFEHIKNNGKAKEIYVDYINGVDDHLHCLLALNADMSISKAVQLLKGEASFWANRNKLFSFKLDWSDEYFAASVSESQRDRVRDYIKNQEEHHKKVTFQEEFQAFIQKLNLQSQG